MSNLKIEKKRDRERALTVLFLYLSALQCAIAPIPSIPEGYMEHANKTGKRALHEAAQHGQNKMVQWLLEHGAAVDALKQADWTPLMLAAEKANLGMVYWVMVTMVTLHLVTLCYHCNIKVDLVTHGYHVDT